MAGEWSEVRDGGIKAVQTGVRSSMLGGAAHLCIWPDPSPALRISRTFGLDVARDDTSSVASGHLQAENSAAHSDASGHALRLSADKDRAWPRTTIQAGNAADRGAMQTLDNHVSWAEAGDRSAGNSACDGDDGLP
jgi:hypothetical protein